MNKYQYYNQERCGGLLLPFLAGALVSAPIAYLAGNNNTPEYVFPPQYPPQQYYLGYQQPVYTQPMYQQVYNHPYPLQQNFYPQTQNPL